MFPTKVRYTGASMGYQLAGIVGGALAPIISVALLDRFDTSVVVSVYVVAMLLVTIICVFLAPETSKIDLHAADVELAPDMSPTRVDLNSDLGEGFGVWRLGDDEALLEIVTSANVACGFHAGDPDTLRRVCATAAERGSRDRCAGELSGPGRVRSAGHRRPAAEPDQRGHLPDRGARRVRPGGRHAECATSSRTVPSTTASSTTRPRPRRWSPRCRPTTPRCRCSACPGPPGCGWPPRPG